MSEDLERAVSLAAIAADKARRQITATEDEITVTKGEVAECDRGIDATHAKGEPVDDLRERRLDLERRLTGLRRELPGLAALLERRETDVRDAEQALWLARKELVARDVEREAAALIMRLRQVQESVETIDGLMGEYWRLQYALRDLPDRGKSPLWTVGLDGTDVWVWLRRLVDGPSQERLLARLERHPARSGVQSST